MPGHAYNFLFLLQLLHIRHLLQGRGQTVTPAVTSFLSSPWLLRPEVPGECHLILLPFSRPHPSAGMLAANTPERC